MALSEVDVLKPKDPSIVSWDDWPTYTLRKTSIISQVTGESVSLLKAHKDHAVKITGYLDTITSDQAQQIRDPKYKTKAIEIVDVVFYAFAEYQDGSYGFWAAGKAGWFEIKEPVAAFQRSYNMMKEAASMFYLLADKLRRVHKGMPKPTVRKLNEYAKHIFREYLSSGRNHLRRADEYEVSQGFDIHSEFLMTSMLEGQEGLDWHRSLMFHYFKHKFPEQLSKIQTRLRPENIAEMKANPLFDKVEAPTQKATAKRGRKRKRGLHPQPEPSVKPTDQGMATSDDSEETESSSKKPFQKRKSILQPTGSKFSKKAAGRRRSLPQTGFEEAEEDIEEDAIGEGLEERDGPTPPPRDQEQMDSDDRDSPPPAETSSKNYHDYLPRKYVDVKLVEYDLPSCRPEFPGDLWSCPFERCNHEVQGASSKTGQASIKEHYEHHAQDAQKKIDLVHKESRPYLPVGNLVRRLQNFVPRPELFPSVSPPDGPAPIRRLY